MKKYHEHAMKSLEQEISFYHLLWFFMMGSIFGYCLETIWYFMKRGYFVNRQGVIYGPFSQIYGLGFVILILFLYRFRNRGNMLIFLLSGLLGEVFEYFSSVFQEKVLNIVSWNYGEFRYNLNGRINLQFIFLWGIVGILVIKYLYPWCCAMLDRMPRNIYLVLSWAFLIFMIFDLTVSLAAQHRQLQRHMNVEASNAVQLFLDEYYPDERLDKIYTSVEIVK